MDEFPENFGAALDPAPFPGKNVAIFSTKFFRSKMTPPPPPLSSEIFRQASQRNEWDDVDYFPLREAPL